jgi:hypothetical protein
MPAEDYHSTYHVIFDMRVLDALGAQFCPMKVMLTSSIAEIVSALLRTMELVQDLCKGLLELDTSTRND